MARCQSYSSKLCWSFGANGPRSLQQMQLPKNYTQPWDSYQPALSKMVLKRPSRPVLPFCPFWLHAFICLNPPELHCWLSSHPHCIKMLGLCFPVYVRRSQGAGTDPAKDSMPRACRRGQGLPSDLPKDSLCLHLVVIDCKFVVRKVFGMTLPKTACPGHAIELDALKYPILSVLRKGTDFLQTQWVMCMALPHMWNKKKGALIKPWPPRN